MATVSARLEVRVRPESKSRVEHAAALLQMPVSHFVRSAVEERAEQVLAEHEAFTRVPATFYDELIAALQTPAEPSAALVRAAKRARDVVGSA
ncbi:MAG: DUF1778 domain-containing protein [Phycicoccus sp.]|nr:DUF1778 domain-containing protein [Phycicoccus sp.]NMM33019.1 DUF1778 domain-containing protein [Phycicoccus sp.]